MKKVNKILMAVIAILLSLVLISTSVVSGIFAKFVITKGAEVPIKFKKLGVTLNILHSSDIEITNTTNDGKSVSVTFSGLNLSPGETKDNVIGFAFDGQQNFPIWITADVMIRPHADFMIAASGFDSLESDTAFMPLKFKVGTLANKDATTYQNVETTEAWISDTNYDNFVQSVSMKVCEKVKVAMDTTGTIGYGSAGACVTESFTATEAISFRNSAKGIGFGFEWPLGDTSDASEEAALRNAIEKHLTEKFTEEEIPITVTIKFTLAQKQN